MITQHLAENTGEEIPIGGVIIFPMIGYRYLIPEEEMIEMIIEGALAVVHQSDILCHKEIDYIDEEKDHIERGSNTTRGSSLRDNLIRGSSPKEIYPFPLMSNRER
jgi:hypothetical protein